MAKYNCKNVLCANRSIKFSKITRRQTCGSVLKPEIDLVDFESQANSGQNK